MDKHLKWVLAVVLSAIAVAGVCFFLSSERDGSSESSRGELKASRRIADAQRKSGRKVTRIVQKKSKQDALREWQETHEKPNLDLEEEELAKLDELDKKVLRALQDALDSNDFDFVRRAIGLMKQLGRDRLAASGKSGGHWSSHVPSALKQAAIDALGWFGSEALPELTEMMGDADPDIAQSATDQLELAMQDCTMADYERAEIIKMISQVITDPDTLDWMFMGAIDARHSVGVETLLYVSQFGTDQAKSMLPDYVELFTGEEDITTEAQLREWLDDYPDEPDDEDFYGPMTED